MLERLLAQPEEKSEPKLPSNTYKVLYDGQCEICQSCVSWLKTLDHENRTVPLPISSEVLPSVDSRLRMEDCLRQLHVITPKGEIRVGWDAVAHLAHLFRPTWLIGMLGRAFPFRNLGRLLYGFVATNRYSLSKCRVGRAALRNLKKYGSKPGSTRSGHVIRSVFSFGCLSCSGQGSPPRHRG